MASLFGSESDNIFEEYRKIQQQINSAEEVKQKPKGVFSKDEPEEDSYFDSFFRYMGLKKQEPREVTEAPTSGPMQDALGRINSVMIDAPKQSDVTFQPVSIFDTLEQPILSDDIEDEYLIPEGEQRFDMQVGAAGLMSPDSEDTVQVDTISPQKEVAEADTANLIIEDASVISEDATTLDIKQLPAKKQTAYGAKTRAGTRKIGDIEGVVLHHTHSARPSTVDSYYDTGMEEGTGAPFFIDRQGVIHQVAPLTDIVQHTSKSKGIGGYRSQTGERFSSSNTIGIEIDAQWDYKNDVLKDAPNEKQIEAAKKLVNYLLNIVNAERPEDAQLGLEGSVYAHPEVQAKQEVEALGVLKALRTAQGLNADRAITRDGKLIRTPRPKQRPE